MKHIKSSFKYITMLWVLATLSGCQLNSAVQETVAEPEAIVPPAPSLSEYCAENVCRNDIDVFVATVNGEVRFQNTEFWPVVYNQEIIVLPGDRVFIEAELDDNNTIQNLRYVETNEHPERTFELYFRQVRGNYGMLLSLRNPFELPIQFDMALTDVAGNQTTVGSCPVRAQRSYFERWAQPATKITLSNPRVLAANAAIVCTG